MIRSFFSLCEAVFIIRCVLCARWFCNEMSEADGFNLFIYGCMLVNHWPSQQSCKESYEQWKSGATPEYYASHTKITLPMRKSVPRSSRESDHTKTSGPSYRDANWSGMDMSPVHQVWSKPSCKAQWKGEENKADRKRSGKITLAKRRAWRSPSLRGQWGTKKNGGNWLWSHLWCPSDPRC